MSGELLLTIVSASLLGSTHCAGMCGPIVLLMLGRGGPSQAGSGSPYVAGRLLCYHLGRLTTYVILGIIAGMLGMTLNKTGAMLGWQRFAAYLAGITMVASAAVLLLRQLGVRLQHLPVPQPWVKGIYAGFKWAQRWPALLRAWWIGLLTTWIPCGWLYAFVIMAASTGNALTGSMVMLAFWLGTVPLLSMLGIGFVHLSPLWRQATPWIAIAACLFLGWSTLYHRSVMNLDSLQNQFAGVKLTTNTVPQLNETKLPCCHDD
jgi:uncharacterized protein